jgi:hypothetical protein
MHPPGAWFEYGESTPEQLARHAYFPLRNSGLVSLALPSSCH